MHTFRRIRSHARRATALVIALLALVPTLAARADATLDPKAYRSPDGRYTLFVDPSSSGGVGKANYEFKKDGKLLWGGEREYTLWEAVVFDSGMVGGYSYNNGYNGRSFGRGEERSTLSMMVIDRMGMVRQTDERTRAHPAGIMSNPPAAYVPRALGIVADPSANWFAVRLQEEWDSKEERWIPFDAATATRLAEVTPHQPKHGQYGFHRDISCGVVPGTGLVLVHWYIWAATDGGGRENSARLSLLDKSGKQVWELDLPGEYDGLKGEVGEWSWHWDLVRPEIVQSGTGDKRFWFHSYKLGERIEYVIEPGPDAAAAWKVHEVSRKAAGPPQAKGADEIVEIERAPLGSFKLQAEAPGASASPLHHLRSLAIGSDGTMAVIRQESPATLVIVRPDGTVVAEHSLAPIGDRVLPEVAALPGSRWLLYTTGLGEEQPAAWVFDPANPAALTRLDQLSVGALRTAATFADGGFVGITGADWQTWTITAFDPQGRVRWNVQASNPKDVCVTSDGRVAVLQGIGNSILYLNPDGTHDRVVDLRKWMIPNYVAGLAADRDRGLVLYDFNGSPSVFRIDANDKGVAEGTPKYADGRTVSVRTRVHASPVDGRLWVCAPDALVRLGPGAKADLVLGEAAAPAAVLRDLNGLSVQADGTMYAINAANASVHVFNKDATLRRVLRPLPDDFEPTSGSGSIAVLGDGSVLYTPGAQYRGKGKSSFVRFGPDGTRVGRERAALSTISEDWYAIPGTQRRWAVAYESIGLMDENGRVTKTITRRPGDQWLGKTADAGVAPDGSIGVVCGPDAMGTRGPAVVCIYTSQGEPVKTLPVPVDTIMVRIAFNGRTAALTQAGEVYLIPVDAGPTRRFKLPPREKSENYWYLTSSPDGTELWARSAGTLEVVRFPFDP